MSREQDQVTALEQQPVMPNAESAPDLDDRLREEMVKRAAAFAKDPEYAICLKVGLGSCFKF